MNKREITPFFAKEFFPSYIEGSLDHARKQAIDKFLSEDGQTKKQYEAMKAQVRFLDGLSQVSPKPDLIIFIEKYQGGWSEIAKKYGWSRWSSTTQWSAQLVVLGILLVVAVHVFPWLNFARSIKSIKQTAPQLKSVQFQEPETPRTFYGPLWPKDYPSPEEYAKKMEEEKQKNAAIADLVIKADEENNPQATEENEGELPAEGFLWRGVLKVEHLDNELARKITAAVVELGGQKAGQVELGWLKGDSRYYHFMMPLKNYTALQEKMSEFGKLTLNKEKHSRVMKEGSMRIIISVEEAK